MLRHFCSPPWTHHYGSCLQAWWLLATRRAAATVINRTLRAPSPTNHVRKGCGPDKLSGLVVGRRMPRPKAWRDDHSSTSSKLHKKVQRPQAQQARERLDRSIPLGWLALNGICSYLSLPQAPKLERNQASRPLAFSPSSRAASPTHRHRIQEATKLVCLDLRGLKNYSYHFE